MENELAFVPADDRVLILSEKPADVSRGGILLPDSAREESCLARVMAVGQRRLPSGERVAMDLRAGEDILFSRYSGTPVDLAGITYRVIRETDILLVLRRVAADIAPAANGADSARG